MNALARFLVAIMLCLPGLSTAAEPEPIWKPIEYRVGWWIHESPSLIIFAIMKNAGLEFTAMYNCPPGSVMKRADAVWYAGDELSFAATSCDGLPAIEDISFHRNDSFIARLPVLLRIHYEGTVRVRQEAHAK